AATCYAKGLETRSSSSPSCCGTPLTRSVPLLGRITKPPLFQRNAASTSLTMTQSPAITKWYRHTNCKWGERTCLLQRADPLPTTGIAGDQPKIIHHDLSRESSVAFVAIGVHGEPSVSLR